MTGVHGWPLSNRHWLFTEILCPSGFEFEPSLKWLLSGGIGGATVAVNNAEPSLAALASAAGVFRHKTNPDNMPIAMKQTDRRMFEADEASIATSLWSLILFKLGFGLGRETSEAVLSCSMDDIPKGMDNNTLVTALT